MLKYLGRKISGEKFFEYVNKLSVLFADRGLKKGDIVTLMSLITPETIYCIYALNRLGVIINSVYFGMSESEIIETIEKTNSKMLISLDIATEKINNLVPQIDVKSILVLSIEDSFPVVTKALYSIKKRKTKFSDSKMISYSDFIKMETCEKASFPACDGDTVAFIVYTSGSTGIPKGVLLNNRNINSTAYQYMKAGFYHESSDVYMSFIPLFLSIGISLAMHMPLVMGLILDVFPDPAPEAVTKHFCKIKPNHFCGDPHNAVLIGNAIKGDASWLRTLAAGGASPTQEQEDFVNQTLVEHNSKSKLITGFGMTELSSTATTTLNDIYKNGTIGIPLPACNVRITDLESNRELTYGEVGELWIKSPGQTPGYFNNEAANQNLFGIDELNTKWIRTGDLALIDSDGFVFFKGRLKRIYLKQGEDGTPYKIFPQRLEETILNVSNIDECAVIVEKDDEVQNIQIAYVVSNGNEAEDKVIKRIRQHCIDNLPNFMVPERIVVIKKLPRLLNGKIDYRSLEDINTKSKI